MNDIEFDDDDSHPVRLADIMRKPVTQWVEPEWWKPEYDEIPGGRFYTEKELKTKLARKRYRDKQKAKPKPEPTPAQLAAKELKRAEARVKESQTKLNNARARLAMSEAELRAADPKSYEYVMIPFRISKAKGDIMQEEGRLRIREARLAALKENTNDDYQGNA